MMTDGQTRPPPADEQPAAPSVAATDPLVPPATDRTATAEPAAPAPAEGQLAATRIVETPPCPCCGTVPSVVDRFCAECGLIFPNAPALDSAVADASLIHQRYQLSKRLGACAGVERFAGLDLRGEAPVPVVVLRESLPPPPAEGTPPPRPGDSSDALYMPELAAAPPTMPLPSLPMITWPGVEWERIILERAEHLSLPRVLDHFQEAGFVYLVEEHPPGRPLWDAWRDPAVPQSMRYGWLVQIAEALHSLHEAGAIVAGLRPELLAVTPTGQAVIADLRDLLPIPVPSDAPVPATHYTAPELLFHTDVADPRSDLYGFGGVVYALSLGRDLTDSDFQLDGSPVPFLERFPDAHPLLGRLVSKTFNPEIELRFPANPGDGTAGIEEVIRALDACQRNASRVRLDVAAWTNTGMFRPGNEDAVAVHHCVEGRLDELDESAFLLLADGMGGVESGEVAAAIAVQTVRKFLLEEPPFCGMTQGAASALRTPVAERLASAAVDELSSCTDGGSTMDVQSPPVWPSSLMLDLAARSSALRSAEAHEERVATAIREANRQVFQAASYGLGNRGMGCTIEVVLVDGPTVVVGHVGDSRTYHLSGGQMVQVTRDQTLVNRLLELGQITPEQAENHPRRSELQQAVGGRSEVFPDVYMRHLQPGDWLLVCSDGLTGQLRQEIIQEIVEGSPSAERAARRLVNRANLEGSLDNVSVIALRAM